ncbi:nudix hydrolase [Nannochloropsis oceanica]
MASPSSTYSFTSSAFFTWVADYEINLQSSNLQSSSASIAPPTFNSNGNDETTVTSPTILLPPNVTAAATDLHPLSEPTLSSPPPNKPLAKLWTIRRRLDSNSSIKHTLAGIAGIAIPTTSDAQPRPFLLADSVLEQDKNVCKLLLRGLGGDNSEAPVSDEKEVEHVSWVDNHGHDLLSLTSKGLPRPLVHRLNILHKGAGILVRDEQKRVFVHQRAAHKRLFPSMYDMFVGGVSLFGEDTRETAGRELKEELGFWREGGEGNEEAFRFLFHVLIETSYNRCFVDVYEYVVHTGEEGGKVRLDSEEVQWGEWATMEEVKRRVALDGQEGQWTFVPDGLLVWRALVQAQGGEEGVV